jgi:hypothetical protein
MEEKVIGYASIKPSEELRKLLEDPSYSIVNSKLNCEGIDEPLKATLKELKDVDIMTYNHAIKLLVRQGITLKPEEIIRANAKKLIGTFEVHELKPSDYFGIEGQDGQEIDKLLSFTEKYLGHTGMMYLLHPISDYHPELPMLAGELSYVGTNLYPLSLHDVSPEAIVTKGTNRLGNGNKLLYGMDVFQRTNDLKMRSEL